MKDSIGGNVKLLKSRFITNFKSIPEIKNKKKLFFFFFSLIKAKTLMFVNISPVEKNFDES